jgi:Glycosyltransferases, probably involved in cell wall biogenesis
MKLISIICPIYNEEKYISECINSILQSNYSKDNLEVIFIDGMSTDRTRDIIDEYLRLYPFIRLLDNPERATPFALNIGVKASNGDVIFRIDAHAKYPIDYFKVLVCYLEELNAENVGGICKTLPANNTLKCIAISEAMSCPFAMGNSYFRIGSKKIMRVDTVPFGCFNKSLFDKIGHFDEELIRNQDDEFNGRIKKNGGEIYLIPEVIIDYYARDKTSKVSKMYFQYGMFKPLVNKKLGSPATLRQFFPIVFLFGLVIGALLSIYSHYFLIPYSFVICLYLLLSMSFAIKIAKQKKYWKLIAILPVIFFTIHISYGYGYLVGIYKIIMHKKFSVEINR